MAAGPTVVTAAVVAVVSARATPPRAEAPRVADRVTAAAHRRPRWDSAGTMGLRYAYEVSCRVRDRNPGRAGRRGGVGRGSRLHPEDRRRPVRGPWVPRSCPCGSVAP